MVVQSSESDLDIQFDLIADPRRQLALEVLDAYESRLTLRDLTSEIVTREHDTTMPNVSSSAVRELRISLHHIHLPKLDGADLISYERTRTHIKEVDRDALQPMFSIMTADAPQSGESEMSAGD